MHRSATTTALGSTRQRTTRPILRTVGTLLLAAVLTLISAAPAAAHSHSKLSARILTAKVLCDEITYPFCAVEGKVRVSNKRAKKTARIVICVGIDVHTRQHRNVSVEPPSPAGQAIVTLKPRTSRVVPYRTVFDASAGVSHHVHVTHVHKHVVHNGGRQC